MPIAFSVAIPCFNRADLIGETLESVLSQRYPPKEIVVCDDGSTDGSLDVIRQFEARVSCCSIENSGPAIARKTAIEATRCEWIALCDSDDIWEPDYLERKVSLLQEFPEANFVFSNFTLFGDGFDGTFDKFASIPQPFWEGLGCAGEDSFCFPGKGMYPRMLEYQPAFQSAIVFNRQLYDTIGGISGDVSRLVSEDMHLTRRMIAWGTVAIDKEISVRIRRHDSNFSESSVNDLKGSYKILQMFVERKEIPDEYVTETLNEIEKSRTRLFEAHRYARQYKDAIEIARDVNVADKDMIFYLKYLQCCLLALGGAGSGVEK